MGLAIMILGLAVFIGTHVVTTQRAVRAALIARLGEAPYKVALFVRLARGPGADRLRLRAAIGRPGGSTIWYPPTWTRHVTVLLVWSASIFVSAAYSPGRIKTALKYPMLVGMSWGASRT